jgi:ATP-dependent Lon protease
MMDDWELDSFPTEVLLSQGTEAEDLPLLPVRDTVLFPHVAVPLFVGRDRSMKAVEAAMAGAQRLAVFAQKDAEVQLPGIDDLYECGTEARIGRVWRMPDQTTSVAVQGRRRLRLLKLVQAEPYLVARVLPVVESVEPSISAEALMRAVLTLFEKVVRLSRSIPDDAFVMAMNANHPSWLADLVASNLDIDVAKQQELLETVDPLARLEKVSVFLAKELDVLELESRIYSQVQQSVDKSQREYFLREQMRAIQSELDESDPLTQEIAELQLRIAESQMPEEVRQRADKELSRLASMPSIAPEASVIRTYIDWLLDLPWAQCTEDNLDIAHAEETLNKNHYGLTKAKERILEYIAVRKLAPDKMRSTILCFVGPPGTGKTSLGQSIAEALERNFVRVSLGGIRDEAEIRGHRRTYVGALPGRIIQTMRRAGTNNPVFMMDEIDKVGIDFRGDPSAALLEVLDPEQNNAFSDHYLEVPYDLSQVMFITTANILDPVPPALRDRLEVIEFPGYIEEEKIEIARQFLVPRQLEQHGLTRPHFPSKTLQRIIREYTFEAGVRNLERGIATICRKVARLVAEGKRPSRYILPRTLHKYLGPPKFLYGQAEEADEVGVATGLSWTEAGGDTIAVEVTVMPGKGNLLLTGQLGDVMQESAQAALSYTRAHVKELGIENVDFDKMDIHIHVPEGAIPKDGPSAGITIATALISSLAHRPVHREVGMTGEITLRGRVLPVGGLREKVLAAYRAGLKTLLMPKKNKKDLVDVPRKVQRGLNFVFVERMDEVVPVALVPSDQTKSRKRTVSSKNRQSVEGYGQEIKAP